MTLLLEPLRMFRLLAPVAIIAGAATTTLLSGYGDPEGNTDLRSTINQAVESLWERVDGPVLRSEQDRPWLWGPSPISTAIEPYPDSPSGTRTLVYYDKGRLDVLDANADPADDWYAVGGLLVREMLAGCIQLGDEVFVPRPSPNIPLTGDVHQNAPVTYSILARFATPWHCDQDASEAATDEAGRASDRTGEAVSDYLGADGLLVPSAVGDSTVRFSSYDPVTGHNVADVFASWNAAQPFPTLYLLGHPISEPYWIDTVIAGRPERVLTQAFERRVMSYRPQNPEHRRVETSNVGIHYRDWRGLAQITDPDYMLLASGTPFGEEIVAAAMARNVDPFMVTALNQVVSGDGASDEGEGRTLTMNYAVAPDGPVDPAVSAEESAQALADWVPESGTEIDWREVLANYYSQGAVDWSDGQLTSFVDEVLATYGELKEQFPRYEPDPVPQEIWGGLLDTGPAAYYDPSYTTDWWERTQQLYARIGVIAPEYEPDPNGYYCVRPGYRPGERLRLRANGVTITCTVGDMVADHDLYNWLQVSNWAVELSWSAFTALGLEGNNYVEVDYPGGNPKPPPAY